MHPNQIAQWRKQLQEEAPQLFTRGSGRSSDEHQTLVDALGGRVEGYALARYDVIPSVKLSLHGGVGLGRVILEEEGDFQRLRESGIFPAAMIGASFQRGIFLLDWTWSVVVADIGSFTGAEVAHPDIHYISLGLSLR